MKKIFLCTSLVLMLLAAAPAAFAQGPANCYTVAPGDTLTSIAMRMGLDPLMLAQMNNLPNPDQLSVGQVLCAAPVPYPQPYSTEYYPLESAPGGQPYYTPNANPNFQNAPQAYPGPGQTNVNPYMAPPAQGMPPFGVVQNGMPSIENPGFRAGNPMAPQPYPAPYYGYNAPGAMPYNEYAPQQGYSDTYDGPQQYTVPMQEYTGQYPAPSQEYTGQYAGPQPNYANPSVAPQSTYPEYVPGQGWTSPSYSYGTTGG